MATKQQLINSIISNTSVVERAAFGVAVVTAIAVPATIPVLVLWTVSKLTSMEL